MTKRLSSVDRVYETLRDMAINFDFKPGERINESALTTKLGASRTPLREALNRLVAEGFLTLAKGQGFFCRPLEPAKVLELYQARCAIETEGIIRGIENASDAEIQALCDYLDEFEKTYFTSTDLTEVLQQDEEFHLRLAALSGNGELVRLLSNLNERIRYVRLINFRQIREQMEDGAQEDPSLPAHRKIVDAVKNRDTDTAVTALRSHIERRSEETIELVRLAYSQLYVPSF
ncbi:GntR family transcriptional regulator [Roseibium sp. MMSF_3412]|uniref:GntR family transcriptional regulator n=1 Tax=Roseibium sp. MMSF_3412 TaxID=3046712 RepID=UPI00273E1904|nr:GntR family transcriptional regulator [Roseibium sp. MMSF_3412]